MSALDLLSLKKLWNVKSTLMTSHCRYSVRQTVMLDSKESKERDRRLGVVPGLFSSEDACIILRAGAAQHLFYVYLATLKLSLSSESYCKNTCCAETQVNHPDLSEQ